MSDGLNLSPEQLAMLPGVPAVPRNVNLLPVVRIVNAMIARGDQTVHSSQVQEALAALGLRVTTLPAIGDVLGKQALRLTKRRVGKRGLNVWTLPNQPFTTADLRALGCFND